MIDGVRLPGLEPPRVALITGAGGAIGFAVAEAMRDLGMSLAVLGRSESRMHEVASHLGEDRAVPLVADVTDAGSVRAAVAAIDRRFGRIDVLVHAAAVSEGNVPLLDLSEDLIDTVLRVNLFGSMVLGREVAPVMMRRGTGAIVNVSSVAAHQAMPGRNVYGTTKAGLIQLTRQLAVELGPHGIRANSVSPGQTPTEITRVSDPPGRAPRRKGEAQGEAGEDRIPLRRRGLLEDYVGPVLFLASDLAAYVTGVDIPVEGGTLILR